MFVEPRRPVAVDELIRGMVVQSGNDACVALAEATAGSEEVFAQMMNREAARLGMKNTHFMNSTGLPDAQHYSTAQDLYRSEEHTSELQSPCNLVCRLLLEKKK